MRTVLCTVQCGQLVGGEQGCRVFLCIVRSIWRARLILIACRVFDRFCSRDNHWYYFINSCCMKTMKRVASFAEINRKFVQFELRIPVQLHFVSLWPWKSGQVGLITTEMLTARFNDVVTPSLQLEPMAEVFTNSCARVYTGWKIWWG